MHLSPLLCRQTWLRVSVLAILLTACQSAAAKAGPVRVATIDTSVSYSGEFHGQPVQQFFALTFQTSGLIPPVSGDVYFGIPFQDSSTFPFSYCVGCSLALPIGWTGSMDLAGGSGYSEFVSDLANGVNDGSLWQLSVFTRSDGRIIDALGTVKDETEWFSSGVDPSRWQIDFVRLTVSENFVAINNDLAFADIRYRTSWEFWGTPPPTPVPEPASLSLLTVAFTGLIVHRRCTTRRKGYKMQRVTYCLLACVLFAGGIAHASPLVIDFEELQSSDALIRSVGPVYTIDGFMFQSFIPEGSDNDPHFNIAGTLSTTFYGSTALFNGDGNATTRLTRADGGRFDILSIDLIEVPNFHPGGWPPIDFGSFELTFFGLRANGGTVEATATIGPFPAVTTFEFSGFRNLVAVEWVQGGGGAGSLTHQFDNLQVRAVPEPSTLLLLTTGLAVAYRRRRQALGPAGRCEL